MSHQRNELTYFSRADIEELAKFSARLKLVGDIYIGAIGTPQVRWDEAGGIEVITPHTPAVLARTA